MITCSLKYKYFNFPTGERHIVIESIGHLPIANVNLEYENDSEIMELLLINDAIKRLGGKINELHIPYVPYSRQDRINVQGESFSLKVFCDLINYIGANTVHIIDPHSDVTSALLNNAVIIPQHEIFENLLIEKNNFFLVCPDGGALKKIYKLATATTPLGIIECSKRRNPLNGEITGVYVPCGEGLENDFIIVDDICDGGRTFIEISKVIKQKNPNSKVILMVSHGFFTKGLEVFDGLINEVYTRKGRVK